MTNAFSHTILAFFTLAGGLSVTGCGQSEPGPHPVAPAPVESEVSSSNRLDASATPSTQPQAARIPAPEIPPNAPVLSEVHPRLSNGALKFARLANLPEGGLLQAEGVSITQADLDAELAQVPEASRDELRRHAFLLVEQQATMALIQELARAASPDAPADEEALMREFFEQLTRDVTVSDAEVEAFFKENGDLVGPAKLEEIAPRIRGHLLGQKQQAAVETFIAEIGSKTPIAVSAEWVAAQAALILDNPVDRARASGKPTFVNFGSKGCRPCDMMEPLREEIKAEYGERLNVVFVSVNQERMLSSRYGISGIPHLVFFDKEGREVHTQTGFMPKDQILSWVEKAGVAL